MKLYSFSGRGVVSTSSVILLASVLSITGCQSITRLSPAEQFRSRAASPAVTEVVVQNQINKEIIPSNVGASAAGAVAAIPGIGILLAAAAGGVGGAVDASVNAKRAKEAEKEIQPLRDVMTDFNFDEELKNELDTQLKSVAWLQPSAAEVSKDPGLKISTRTTTSANLYVVANYALSPDFSELHVKLTAQEVARKAAARKKTSEQTQDPPPLYRNSIMYSAKLPVVAGQTNEQRLELWKKGSDHCLAESTLEKAIFTVSKELSDDLAMTPDAVKQQLKNKEYKDYKMNPKAVPTGKIVAKSDSQTIVRNKDGSITIIETLTAAQ